MKGPSILEALDDPALFGEAFAAASWWSWRAFLACVFGLGDGLPEDLRQLVMHHTGGRSDVLGRKFREVWLICGRRAGKSRILALIAVYLACFIDWRGRLVVGEVGVIMILAADRDQAAVILNYIKGLLSSNSLLARLVTDQSAERVELGSLKVNIEVHTNNYRAPRGRTVIAALCDEVAFWRSDTSANPGRETVRALRPALATLAPDSLLIGASSPYARFGLLWDRFRRYYGEHGAKVLIWKATSLEMNSGLDPEIIADALEEDPEGAAAEYLAEFRRDVSRFISQEIIEAAVISGRHELPRTAGTRYFAFIDPSGGSADSFTMAVAHRDGEHAVLDCTREVRPPFSPETVADDFAEIIKSYGCTRATSDKYGGVWVAETFAKRGVTVEQCAKPKTDLYGELLPGLNSGRVELLDHPRLLAQLAGLERRTSRSGRDSIDHGPGAHDDIINSAAGALVAALSRPPVQVDFEGGVILGPPTTAETLLDSWSGPSDWRSYWHA